MLFDDSSSGPGLRRDVLLVWLALPLDGLRSLGESLHLKSVSRLEEGGQLFLWHVHLPGVHELQDRLQVAERHILQDNDGMFWRVFLDNKMSFQICINIF